VSEASGVLAQPFDAAAPSYDTDFTERRLGRWLREAVWGYLGAAFQPGEHVLELGCGTGEDAVWLARRGVRVEATDGSPAMLAAAQRKVAETKVGDRVSFSHLDLNAIGSEFRIPHSAFYDGAFSNFGALNCVPDRRPIAEALAGAVRSGGRVVLVVMGPLCPWEWAWHLGHGQAGTAFRRFRRGVEAHVGDGRTVRVWYPSPRRLCAEFAPEFKHIETVGIGAFLPPSYFAHLVDRWPRMFGGLAKLDSSLGRFFPWTWLNDHYLMVLERKPRVQTPG
jgi:SAM-dependent methyltransferase